MKNNTTELVFIIDKSGSMAGMESDTVGGFNAMIEKQKKLEGKCYVSTVLFSNGTEVLHDRMDLQKVEALTRREYCVGGCTALLDAIGDAIHHIENIHKYARPEDVPEHTMFLITTDGMENASRKYTADSIKKMIKQKEEECGWEFIFIAANIDAVETAGNYGISPQRAVNYRQDGDGTRATYASMNCAITSMRRNKDIDRSGWKEELDKGDKR